MEEAERSLAPGYFHAGDRAEQWFRSTCDWTQETRTSWLSLITAHCSIAFCAWRNMWRNNGESSDRKTKWEECEWGLKPSLKSSACADRQRHFIACRLAESDIFPRHQKALDTKHECNSSPYCRTCPMQCWHFDSKEEITCRYPSCVTLQWGRERSPNLSSNSSISNKQ